MRFFRLGLGWCGGEVGIGAGFGNEDRGERGRDELENVNLT